jgi:selenocysteine-specific translation elongation factor|tara:strand:- start:1 stop:1035 length:1035 start_codon:yes stop_codon:yes gene_type:complete
MPVLNIAMIGTDDLAREIAKATDQRDVHTYVHKEPGQDGPRILSIIRPAKYPERLRPFLNALSAARVGLIEITGIDATLGESLVAFASANITNGIAVINAPQGEWVDEEQVKMLFKQAGLEEWTFGSMDGIQLRNTLYQHMDDLSDVLSLNATAPLVIPVDQHFNVKGIGLVAIGYVQSGTVNVHDDLILLPANGTGNAKSLQVMDDDVAAAVAGDRVGLALRNAKEDHLGSGTLLVRPAVEDKKTNTNIPLAVVAHNHSKMKLSRSPFQKRILAEGDVVHASVDLQFVVGRVGAVNGDEMEVVWETPLFIRRENPESTLIAQLDSKPRIMGNAILTPFNDESA